MAFWQTGGLVASAGRVVPAMQRDAVAWLACMLVASAGLVACLWAVPYIPTPDGPQHILSAHIENRFGDAGAPYAEVYRLLPQYAGKGFALVFAPLESLLPWRLALRLALSVIALSFAWGFALFVLALHRRSGRAGRRAISLLGFLVALPWSLYMGFFPFVVGVTIGVWTLAYVVHRPPTTALRCALLSFLLLLQGVSHVFTAVMTAAVVATIAIFGAPREKRLHALGRMILVGAPTALLLALTYSQRELQSSSQNAVEWDLAARSSEISRWFVPGPGIRGWVVIALVIAGIATTLVRRRDASAPERLLAWAGLVFLGLTFFAPIHIPKWQLFAPRFAIMATVLGLALLRVPERVPPRVARALLPLVAALCLVFDLVSEQLHRQLANGCADSLAGLDAPLHFTGPRMPIVLDAYCGAPDDRAKSPVPWAAMANNVNLLYLIDHGGVATRLFNGAPAIHALAFREGRRPPLPDFYTQSLAASRFFAEDPKLRTSVLTQLAANGMPFEGIHVVGGRPEDFALFNARGYVTEFQQGSLFIGRFEGCPSELVLPAGALDREPVFFEYGLFSRYVVNADTRPYARVPIPRETPAVDGLIHVPLPGRPCGLVWVRVVWDADGSATFTPGERTCEKAKWEGRLLATVTRDRLTVSCTPMP
ncbi:MAG: hypothetical protein JWO86_4291 [Myxococcaceae bacterium]|nr:hypothetical protein [Myxococcaceae bacterium]